MSFKAHLFVPEENLKRKTYWKIYRITILPIVISIFLMSLWLQSWVLALICMALVLSMLLIVLVFSNSIEELRGSIKGEMEFVEDGIFINNEFYSAEDFKITRMVYGDYYKRSKYNLLSVIRHGIRYENWSIANFDTRKEVASTLYARIKASAVNLARANELLVVWDLFEPNLSRGNRNFIELKGSKEVKLIFFFLDSKQRVYELKTQIGELVKSGMITCNDGLKLSECKFYKEIQEFKSEYCK